MPNKYPNKKGWKVPKQHYKLNNWHEYNNALRKRGSIDIWISQEVVKTWYEQDQVYDGTGTPKKFTDLAIMMCHEIRQVFKLPFRQCQGFIDSLFNRINLKLKCPDYSCLSKRLSLLNITSPRYKRTDCADNKIASIAIDSTGLKRFGRGEWHQEKYNLSAKRSWRKLHIAVDTDHIIHGSELTDRFSSDCNSVDPLTEQIDELVDHITADGAYDKKTVYKTLTDYFPNADIVIPPSSNAVYRKHNHPLRNRNFQEIKAFGRMNWQRARFYGRRNYSELSIQRYKKILGPALHARELSRQKNESMIGCGILNKMTKLGMPASYRCT